MFLMKEAYHRGDIDGKYYDLAEDLRNSTPWRSVWHRVCEWTYGILGAAEGGSIPSYRELSDSEMRELIQKIAVVNIKKSHGSSRPDCDNLMRYAKEDRELLYRQIELFAPDIIVCGSTMAYLNEIISAHETPIDKKAHPCGNWHYRWKDRIILDYYHPASRFPALMSYYGIVGCYCDALKN